MTTKAELEAKKEELHQRNMAQVERAVKESGVTVDADDVRNVVQQAIIDTICPPDTMDRLRFDIRLEELMWDTILQNWPERAAQARAQHEQMMVAQRNVSQGKTPGGIVLPGG